MEKVEDFRGMEGVMNLQLFKNGYHISLSKCDEKVKLSPLQAMKAKGDVNARVHIYIGRGRVVSPTLGSLEPPVLILQEAEWTPGPIWT